MTTVSKTGGAFSGHPKALAYLAFTEAWERFSYYGMTGLLVLYMVNQLLLPGHVEHVAGMGGFRYALDGIFGPHSTQALASQIFGLYAGFVYFTPVLGGYIADRWTGQRTAVILGALSMSAGHIAMAFDQSFLLALLLLVVGSGLLKGNISAQIGALYPPDDSVRRTRGFAIFSMAINFGAVAGPIVCGFLASRFGWHIGFGTAAVFMLCGLLTYLLGYRHMPVRVEHHVPDATAATPAPKSQTRIVVALLVVMAITIFQSIGYYQVGNVFPIWVQQHVDLSLGAFAIPIPWFQSIDPLFSIVGVPVLFGLWRRQARGRGEPADLGKIGTGAWLCAASNLILVGAILLSADRPVPVIWPILYCAGQGIAFLYYWPTLLALVSRAAPPRINSTMMGMTFLTLFIANNLIGWIGTFYEKMSPIAFWSLHAAIAATGGILVLMLGPVLASVFRSQPQEGPPPAVAVEVGI